MAVILVDGRAGSLVDSIAENLAGSIVNNLFCINILNESRHKLKKQQILFVQ